MVTLSSITTVTTVVTSLVAALVGIRSVTGRSERLRRRINEDLTLRERLTDGSPERATMDAHVAASIEALVHMQDRQMMVKTDPYGAIWAAIFFVLGCVATAWAWRNQPNQFVEILVWAVAGVFFVFTAIAVKVARDPEKDDA